MDLLSLIDQLDAILEQGFHIPGTGRVLVDKGIVHQMLEQMRTAVPDQVQMGQRIASERERILADARSQARRTIDEAQSQLNMRLDDQTIVLAARDRAREMQAHAENQAAKLRADTNQYVIGQLGALETRLQRLLHEVQSGQRVLAQEESGRTDSGRAIS